MRPRFAIGRRRTLQAATGFLAFAFGTGFAQGYPTKPIRLLVPLAAGSTADIVSRYADGFVAPAGTPAEVITRLNRELNRIFSSPEAKEKLGPQGFDLAPPMEPAAFAKLVVDDLAKWVPMVKASGATAN